MALQGWDKDPLTPFLECLLEITPKAPSSISADYYFKGPACSGKFKQTHRLGLLVKSQDFAVEIRGDPPPAPPLKRLRLYLKNGQPNIEAVSHFIGNCLDERLHQFVCGCDQRRSSAFWSSISWSSTLAQDHQCFRPIS